MKKLIIAMVSFFCGVAAAGELTFGMHVGSYHATGDYNNFNPGVWLRKDDISLGLYYNSNKVLSAHIEKHFELPGNFSAIVGLASGYRAAPVVPMVGLLSPSIEEFRFVVFPKTSLSPLTIHLLKEF